jgi:hypothetical protein
VVSVLGKKMSQNTEFRQSVKRFPTGALGRPLRAEETLSQDLAARRGLFAIAYPFNGSYTLDSLLFTQFGLEQLEA